MSSNKFGVPLTEAETANLPTGWAVPLGRVWLIEGCERVGAAPMAELGALVATIDSQVPATMFAIPKGGPEMDRVCDILDAIFEGTGANFEARFGGFHLWDVRVRRSAEGQYSWDRCRQGWLESSPEFWRLSR